MDVVELGYLAGVALGAFLLLAAFELRRLTPDAPARSWLALYLALVGAGYVLEGFSFFASGTLRSLRVAAVATGMLDPPVLLLYAIESTRARGRLDALPRALVLALGTLAALDVLAGLGVPFTLFGEVQLVVCYLAALALLARAFVRARTAGERDARGALLLAFGVAILPRLPLVFADAGIVRGVAGRAQPITLLYLEGSLALLAAAFSLALRRATPPERRASTTRLLRSLALLCTGVAGLWVLRFFPGARDAAFALLYPARWYFFASVFVAGVQRHRLLGVPARSPLGSPLLLLALLGALAAIELAALLYGLTGLAPPLALAGGAGIVGVVAIAIGAVRAALPRETDDLAWRRQAVYRAHVELGASDAERARLRRSLRIGDEEARELEALADAERLAADRGAGSLREGGVIAERYHVGRQIGALGPTGRVFEATDARTGEAVILKEVLVGPDDAPSARREAQALLAVRHPRVVRLRAIEPLAGGTALVLDRAPGEPLRARLRRGAPLTFAQAQRITLDVLDALDALHEAGLVHRDVKPENVIVAPDGRAVLLDLGEAYRPAAGTQRATHAGTAGYMSPEQERGEPLTPASDVYAAGLLAWECLTLQRPPEGTPPPGALPVLLRALAPDPRERYPSAAAMARALASAAAG